MHRAHPHGRHAAAPAAPGRQAELEAQSSALKATVCAILQAGDVSVADVRAAEQVHTSARSAYQREMEDLRHVEEPTAERLRSVLAARETLEEAHTAVRPAGRGGAGRGGAQGGRTEGRA